MSDAIRVLLVEDNEMDAELLSRQLHVGQLGADIERVDSAETLQAALAAGGHDIIISDYTLPGFSGMQALEMAQQQRPEVPFVFVSGTIGEERAIEALKHGAVDYLLKDRPSRLVPCLRRALDQAQEQRTRHSLERKLARLSHIHALMAGLNAAILRGTDGASLFDEACRLAVEVGGYRFAWIGVTAPRGSKVKPVAFVGHEDGYLAEIGHLLGDAPGHDPVIGLSTVVATDDGGLAGQTLCAGLVFCCNDIETDPMVAFRQQALARGYRSLAALPLSAGAGQLAGVMMLYAADKDYFGDDDIRLLGDLAADLSFALELLDKRARLTQASRDDPLTGLANRSQFFDRLDALTEASKSSQTGLAVVVLDLQRFREINSMLGRAGGDRVLQTFAGRLKRAFDGAATVARMGADRFAVAIPTPRKWSPSTLAAEAKVKALAAPARILGSEVSIAFKMGVATCPADSDHPELLFQQAEAALQRAKDSIELCVFYSPSLNEGVTRRLRMEAKLRRAMRERGFVLHYQPKVRLVDRSVVGLEALIRWNDEPQGLISPAHFVPLLEETGLIAEVGLWVVRQAIADARTWEAQGVGVPRIAVNVSALQLRRPYFAEELLAVLQEAGPGWHGIDLEITESQLLEDHGQSTKKLARLRARGLRVYMDDFGTGYSSLSQLSSLPLDALKIDRAFVHDMGKKPEHAAVVRAVIQLADALGLGVVAEGVETEAQAQQLEQLGCGEAQGYHFSRPLAADAIARAGQGFGGP
ncbi:MAG TPA: EAL domain-containing protein [Methylibium sp.]